MGEHKEEVKGKMHLSLLTGRPVKAPLLVSMDAFTDGGSVGKDIPTVQAEEHKIPAL